MKNIRFSLPQLILKEILEGLLGEKCVYNDRTMLKPYEIDCYFPKWKLGFEYDGKYYHDNNVNDKIKNKLAKTKGIVLIRINELNKIFRKYELNIKAQLKNNLDKINEVTKLNINSKLLEDLKINITYPNVLSKTELDLVAGKKLSEIKKIDFYLYKKIIKFNLINNNTKIIDDRRKKNKKFKNIGEYVDYLNSQNYQNWSSLCEKEHPYRVCKLLNEKIESLKNKIKYEQKQKETTLAQQRD
jgi:very-short-patch-repair endonuclease